MSEVSNRKDTQLDGLQHRFLTPQAHRKRLHIPWRCDATYTHRVRLHRSSLTGNVTAHSPKRFGEGPHHHVHVLSVHPAVLARPATCLPERSDAVRLVQVDIRLETSRHDCNLAFNISKFTRCSAFLVRCRHDRHIDSIAFLEKKKQSD